MKNILTVLLIYFSSLGYAHDYFFAFAEVQFNHEKKRLEISIRVTGHDFEEYMKHVGKETLRMEECINNPIEMQKIKSVLFSEFKITTNGAPLALEIVGMEINNKDEAIFYVTSKENIELTTVTFTFDLLMNYFKEQQNKLTIFTKEGKDYLTFLPHRRIRNYSFLQKQ